MGMMVIGILSTVLLRRCWRSLGMLNQIDLLILLVETSSYAVVILQDNSFLINVTGIDDNDSFVATDYFYLIAVNSSCLFLSMMNCC